MFDLFYSLENAKRLSLHPETYEYSESIQFIYFLNFCNCIFVYSTSVIDFFVRNIWNVEMMRAFR